MKYKTLFFGMMFSVFLLAAGTVEAQYDKELGPVDRAARKLGRGISNIVFSPIEIYNSIYDVQKRDGEVAAVTYGLFQGTTRTVARTGLGIFEIATFPVGGHRPLLEPEFPARKGVLSTFFEPEKNSEYPESDEWKFMGDSRHPYWFSE